MQNTIITVYCLLFFSALANAQSPEALLAEALENNLQLKAIHLEYLAAREVALQQTQLPDPEFGAGIFALPVETRLGPQWLRLGATQMFFWKGLQAAKEDYQLTLADTKLEQLAAQQLQLKYQISMAWLQLYEQRQSAVILNRQLRFLASLEQLALSKVESGKGSTADVLRVQLRQQELQTQVAILREKETSPSLTINQLLNRNTAAEIQTADTLGLAAPLFRKDTIVNWVGQNHPLLNLYKLQQEASQKAIEINRLDAKPDFGVGLDYILVGKRGDADPAGNGRDILMPRVSVKIPISRKKYDAKQREEEYKIAAADNRSAELQTQFLAEIEKAYSNLAEVNLQLNLYTKQTQTIRSVINIIQNEYIAGKRSFEELLRLEQQLLDYDLMRLRALVQSHRALAEINRYIP